MGRTKKRLLRFQIGQKRRTLIRGTPHLKVEKSKKNAKFGCLGDQEPKELPRFFGWEGGLKESEPLPNTRRTASVSRSGLWVASSLPLSPLSATLISKRETATPCLQGSMLNQTSKTGVARVWSLAPKSRLVGKTKPGSKKKRNQPPPPPCPETC